MDINLHTHTNWSDGGSTMVEYAMKAKDLGHTCLVITDHDYMLKREHLSMRFVETEEDVVLKREQFLQQLEEAREVEKVAGVAVIVGLEITIFGYMEGLLFGAEACLAWWDYARAVHKGDRAAFKVFLKECKDKNCALILCHPSVQYMKEGDEFYRETFDGYEVGNSCMRWSEEDVEKLRMKMPEGGAYINYDAHHIGDFGGECNRVEGYIGTEAELIDWIKSRREKGR